MKFWPLLPDAAVLVALICMAQQLRHSGNAASA
jgi:hypothetical protein